MDIVVTIPKTELENVYKERETVSQVDNEAVQFWSVGRKAKELNVGDHVYFVENGQITNYQIFLGYVYNPVCEVTGRTWAGLNLLLKCPSIFLKTPVAKKGFQGFHYIERLV